MPLNHSILESLANKRKRPEPLPAGLKYDVSGKPQMYKGWAIRWNKGLQNFTATPPRGSKHEKGSSSTIRGIVAYIDKNTE